MACESTLNPNADFGTFIRCWCQKNKMMSVAEKRKRAYYWAWQSHNWYSTLLYLTSNLSTFLTDTEWWLLDPTPDNASQVQVSPQLWDAKLDPMKTPWMLYEDVCLQFQAEEVADDALQLIDDILGTSMTAKTPLQVSPKLLDEDKFVCTVCQEEWQYPEVYNVLRQEYLDFLQSQNLEDSDATARLFQQVWGGAEQSPEAITFDAAQPLTAALIRKVSDKVNLPFDNIKADVILFLGQPSATKGPIIHGACNKKHGYHESCIYTWHKTKQESYKKQLSGNNLFADLHNFAPSQKSVLKSGLTPFQCLSRCEGTVTHVYVKPQQQPIALAQDYAFLESQPTDPEWGPYRLKKGALVWAYPTNRHLGGDYAGYLGLLESFTPSENMQDEAKINLDCSFGGCFQVRTLVPNVGLISFPVSAVFDVSFLEYDMLPTRRDVSEVFTPPLEHSAQNFRPYPFYVTENFGYGDWKQSNTDQTEEAPWLHKISKILAQVADNPQAFSAFDKMLAKHRDTTESALVSRAATYNSEARMSAAEMWNRIKENVGAYSSSPPIQINLNSQGDLSQMTLQIRALIQQHRALQILKLHPYQIILFVFYARKGFDILPQYSTVLLPILRSIYPELPSFITPFPSNRQKQVWPVSPQSQLGKRPASTALVGAVDEPQEKKARTADTVWSQNVNYITMKLRQMGFAQPTNDIMRGMQTLEGYLSSQRGIDLTKHLVTKLPVDTVSDIVQRVIGYLFTL